MSQACPACGTDNADAAKFCRSCGKSIQLAAPAPTSTFPPPRPAVRPARTVNKMLVGMRLLSVIGCVPLAGITAASATAAFETATLAPSVPHY